MGSRREELGNWQVGKLVNWYPDSYRDAAPRSLSGTQKLKRSGILLGRTVLLGCREASRW